MPESRTHRLFKPTNYRYKFQQSNNKTDIQEAYHDQFPERKIHEDYLVFDNSETARLFFSRMVFLGYHFLIAQIDKQERLIGYVGPQGILVPESIARSWFNQSMEKTDTFRDGLLLSGG